jgi:predicted heme/steroid binding protein
VQSQDDQQQHITSHSFFLKQVKQTNRQDKISTMDSFAFDVAAGLALGGAIAYMLWLRPEDNTAQTVPLRNFSADELKLYEGTGKGVCYVSVRGKVYDVTPDKVLFQGSGAYACVAGKNTNDACDWLTSKYKVG